MYFTKFKFAAIFSAVLAIVSCGNSNSKLKSLAEGASGNIVAYENSAVNAIQQALPTLMVLPSDRLMEGCGALTTQTVNGKSVIMRDYNKVFTSREEMNTLVSVIQNAFVQLNYPIQDLEQTLKQLETQEALDMVDGM